MITVNDLKYPLLSESISIETDFVDPNLNDFFNLYAKDVLQHISEIHSKIKYEDTKLIDASIYNEFEIFAQNEGFKNVIYDRCEKMNDGYGLLLTPISSYLYEIKKEGEKINGYLFCFFNKKLVSSIGFSYDIKEQWLSIAKTSIDAFVGANNRTLEYPILMFLFLLQAEKSMKIRKVLLDSNKQIFIEPSKEKVVNELSHKISIIYKI